MTLTFLQGQAIYQMLHILVSITQPIVERGYFSRFIWLSRGGRLFLLNAPSAEHNWALLSAQTRLSLTATHGNREEVRMQVTEQMSCGCYHTTVFLNFCFPLVFWLRPSYRSFPVANTVYHSTCLFLHPSEALQ